MQLKNARILLTGASGGLGQELACQFTDAGAALLLAGRDSGRLSALTAALGAGAANVCADLERPAGIATLAGAAREFGVNVLINNAGVSAFGLFENQDAATITRLLATNLEAPIQLTQAPCCHGSRRNRRRPSSISVRPSAACPFRVSSPIRRPRPACAAFPRPAP
jgi:short-subunit dehydrogenase